MATRERSCEEPYVSDLMEPIRIWVPRGQKQQIMDFVRKKRICLADYIQALIRKDMEKEQDLVK